MDSAAHWDTVSHEWTAWARTPGHDVFWAYADQFLDFMPAAGLSTIDVGCGEGRISRLLTRAGHRMTALDGSARLLAAARELRSAAETVHADITAMPFADGTFDLAVSYNVLMDVPDIDTACAEIHRILAPGGTAMISIVHPLTDFGQVVMARGHLDGLDYFAESEFTGTEERDGLQMHFAGWRRPLQAYTRALTRAGFAISAMVEPQPDSAAVQRDISSWQRIPLFLWLLAHKQPA